MYSLDSRSSKDHFIVWMFLGSDADRYTVRILQQYRAHVVGPQAVFTIVGYFTKDLEHHNLRYPNYRSVIDQSNVIDLQRNCVMGMATVRTCYMLNILHTTLPKTIGNCIMSPFSNSWWSNNRSWAYQCISWSSGKSRMNVNRHQCIKRKCIWYAYIWLNNM